FFEALLEKARTIPGVTEVALGGDLQPGTSWQTGVTFMSLPPVQPGKEPLLNAMVASPAWFETVKMRVISGRAFTDADVAGGVPVAIISENVARKFFGAKNPLGELVKRGRANTPGTPATIIGVVNEVRNDGLRVTSKGTIYFPLAQSEAANMWIVARTTAGSGAVIPALRTALASLDKDIPLAQPQKVEEHLASEVSEPKFSMLMLGTFALIALALAAIGIYGVIAYAVSLRTHEIGVRVALGASARTVLLLIVRQVLAITGAGIALGVVAALLSGKVIAKMLFGVSPSDPMAIAAGCVVLGAVALLAAAIPAWRATRMDPVAALRAE
ncbi:MAG TPA: ABC transporter permease, partial [Gemmatimonadaceae bacterium]|nr:ABC transporter permease [Gemmatimonadaceae bacterium]